MKQFLQLIAVLFFALIVAGVYEIFVVREGKVKVHDPLSTLATRYGGWNSLLGLKKDDDKTIAGETDTSTLSKDVSVGKLTSSDYAKLGLPNLTSDYLILEYCSHSSVLCQLAERQKIISHMTDLLGNSVSFFKKPFVENTVGIEEKIWLGENCINPQQIPTYHESVYKQRPIKSNEDLSKIGSRLDEGFDECIEEGSAKLWIMQQMKSGNSLFGVTRVPSYVVVDLRSKSWKLVPGLYEEAELTDYFSNQ